MDGCGGDRLTCEQRDMELCDRCRERVSNRVSVPADNAAPPTPHADGSGGRDAWAARAPTGKHGVSSSESRATTTAPSTHNSDSELTTTHSRSDAQNGLSGTDFITGELVWWLVILLKFSNLYYLCARSK